MRSPTGMSAPQRQFFVCIPTVSQSLKQGLALPPKAGMHVHWTLSPVTTHTLPAAAKGTGYIYGHRARGAVGVPVLAPPSNTPG